MTIGNNSDLIACLERKNIPETIITAFSKVDRGKFIMEDASLRSKMNVYKDVAVELAFQQTISQPSLLAMIIDNLQVKKDDTVLEIGAGSGYFAAVLSRIVKKVIAVERIKKLAIRSKNLLISMGYDNIEIIEADGTDGCKDLSPFDAIVYSAAMPSLPTVFDQLKNGGRLIAPVGVFNGAQKLKMWLKKQGNNTMDNDTYCSELADVRFVPMIKGME